MSLCITAAGTTVALAINAFTLSWSHSVERTEWREAWRVVDDGLVIDRASVEGTGAGMEIPQGAVLQDGVWTYRPDLPVLTELRLSDAGRGQTDWNLCVSGQCRSLGSIIGTGGTETVLTACDRQGMPFQMPQILPEG